MIIRDVVEPIRAPFPWFGGKRRVAADVWRAFGDVTNYVEPFAGSLAVLLGRPTPPQIETVNDADAYLANFWRAVKTAPEEVERWCAWPVNEADLHARHLWLVRQPEFRERMKIDADYYDAKVAGWWVWGLCQWIGSGWCEIRERGDGRPPVQLPHLGTAGWASTGSFRTSGTRGGASAFRCLMRCQQGCAACALRVGIGLVSSATPSRGDAA